MNGVRVNSVSVASTRKVTLRIDSDPIHQSAVAPESFASFTQNFESSAR